jgi:hypothetical protein
MLGTMEHAQGDGSEEARNRFRVFMVPIAAKHAARGQFESLPTLFGYMRVPYSDTNDLHQVLGALRRVLTEHGSAYPAEAIACVERYLDVIEKGSGP